MAEGQQEDQQEERCSFLKKRTKKLLLFGVRAGAARAPDSQKFLVLFSKRTASCF
jgi:hypothetical protein